MLSAFLVFPAWNVSVWHVDSMSCIRVPLSPGFLLWGELAISPQPSEGFLGLDVSQGLVFGGTFLRFSVVGRFPFQTCSKRWNSDHMNNLCVTYNEGSHFFSSYGLLVAVENVYKGNRNVLK